MGKYTEEARKKTALNEWNPTYGGPKRRPMCKYKVQVKDVIKHR